MRAAARCWRRRTKDTRSRTGRARGRAVCPSAAPSSPGSGRCPALCAARPCRPRRRSAGSASRPSRRAHGGPSRCAPPPERYRDAAAPTGHNRSRTAPRPLAASSAARRSCAPPGTARRSSFRQSRAAPELALQAWASAALRPRTLKTTPPCVNRNAAALGLGSRV